MSVLYGVNGILVDEGENYSGLSAGLGQLFQLGKNKQLAISLDGFLVVSSGLYSKLDELDSNGRTYEMFGFRRVVFSLGLKGAF